MKATWILCINSQAPILSSSKVYTAILTKLSQGDMIAIEAEYHNQCLVSLYNQHCVMFKKTTVTNAEEKITTCLFENIVLLVDFMFNSWISYK